LNFLWNVTVAKGGEKNFLTGYQFYAKDIKGAVEQGGSFGTVVKVILSDLEED
jgi:hypothetical protein